MGGRNIKGNTSLVFIRKTIFASNMFKTKIDLLLFWTSSEPDSSLQKSIFAKPQGQNYWNFASEKNITFPTSFSIRTKQNSATKIPWWQHIIWNPLNTWEQLVPRILPKSHLYSTSWDPKHGKTHVTVDGQVLPRFSSQNPTQILDLLLALNPFCSFQLMEWSCRE
jgi:hypothetical protein